MIAIPWKKVLTHTDAVVPPTFESIILLGTTCNGIYNKSGQCDSGPLNYKLHTIVIARRCRFEIWLCLVVRIGDTGVQGMKILHEYSSFVSFSDMYKNVWASIIIYISWTCCYMWWKLRRPVVLYPGMFPHQRLTESIVQVLKDDHDLDPVVSVYPRSHQASRQNHDYLYSKYDCFHSHGKVVVCGVNFEPMWII